MKEVLLGVTTMGVFGVLSWMAVTLISVDKRTEVMSVKIGAEQRNAEASLGGLHQKECII